MLKTNFFYSGYSNPFRNYVSKYECTDYPTCHILPFHEDIWKVILSFLDIDVFEIFENEIRYICFRSNRFIYDFTLSYDCPISYHLFDSDYDYEERQEKFYSTIIKVDDNYMNTSTIRDWSEEELLHERIDYISFPRIQNIEIYKVVPAIFMIESPKIKEKKPRRMFWFYPESYRLEFVHSREWWDGYEEFMNWSNKEYHMEHSIEYDLEKKL